MLSTHVASWRSRLFTDLLPQSHKTAVLRTGAWVLLLLLTILGGTLGCATGKSGKQNEEFFTSGSREADQRASQKMAKAEQLSGSDKEAGTKEK